jgi:hypothetical protein
VTPPPPGRRRGAGRRPLRLLILGSCVTRDAIEYQPDTKPIEVVEYYARSPLASAMHTAAFEGPDLSRIESAFQRRIVGYDLRGEARSAVAGGDWDILLVDFIDERISLLIKPDGARAAQSPELMSSGYDWKSHRQVKAESHEGVDLFRWGWGQLIELLRANGRIRDLRLNRAWWAEQSRTGEPSPRLAPERVGPGNAHLAKLYAHAERDISRRQIYRFTSAELLAEPNHKWGLQPFHFVDAYYPRIIHNLLKEQRRLRP